MTTFAPAFAGPALPAAPVLGAVQRGLLWAVGAGGAIVFIEPSPYELATLAAMILFFATGLRLRVALLPMIALLFAMNVGYTVCAAYLMDRSEIVNWVLTSWYMAVTVVFFAILLSDNTAERLDMLRRGLIAGATVAALAGIVGYFRLIPGTYETLTLYNRARGTFKDPNVLSAFLILPALFVLQNVVTEKLGKALRSAVVLGIIGLALLLAFSRAAWGQMVFTAGFMLLLMFLTAQTNRLRSRIVVIAVVATAVAAALLLVLLSFDSVGGLFKERASLEQGYDGGRFGRFGRHYLGALMALDMPLGIGPLQFTKFFPEDTHNSYLNAFMSGGWIAGLSYPTLIFATVWLGFRNAFVRTPWQKMYLAVFAGFFGTVGESFIIDTDHWRHFWLMLGAMWGMFVANRLYRRGDGGAGPAFSRASSRYPG